VEKETAAALLCYPESHGGPVVPRAAAAILLCLMLMDCDEETNKDFSQQQQPKECRLLRIHFEVAVCVRYCVITVASMRFKKQNVEIRMNNNFSCKTKIRNVKMCQVSSTSRL